MTEIKPCPFCGKKPKLDRISDNYADALYQIGCRYSLCNAKPNVIKIGKERAIEAWNRRNENG